ncbi:MAG: CopG family antitoxin [Gammaproteobacteria bacterium]
MLPPSKSVSELVEFFDTHDMGEYWDQMPEAQFDVRIERKRHLVAIEEEVSAKLTEIAKANKVSSEALVNTWLKERIRTAG